MHRIVATAASRVSHVLARIMLVRLIWRPKVTSNTPFIRTLLYVIFLKFLIHENVHFPFKLLLRAIWLPNPEDHISSLSLGIVRSGKSSGLDDQKALVELNEFGMANFNNEHELVRDVRGCTQNAKSSFFRFFSILQACSTNRTRWPISPQLLPLTPFTGATPIPFSQEWSIWL